MTEAVLRCNLCLTRKRKNVEPDQLQTLRSAGAAQFHCEYCGRDTIWGYAVDDRRSGRDRRLKPRAVFVPKAEPQVPAEASSPYSVLARTAMLARQAASERRNVQQRGQRVPLELPVVVRADGTQEGFEETTHTVNVSRGGVYIHSERPYRVQLAVEVVLDHADLVLDRPLGRGTVVRLEEIPLTSKRGVAIRIA